MKNWILILCVAFTIGCKSEHKESKQENTNNANAIEIWSEYLSMTNKKGKKILLVSGDEEYRSEEMLPQLAKILSERHGFDCTVLYAQNPEKLGKVDPNYSSNIPGLEKLDDSDLLILFTRFRALPVNQMKHINDYLLRGKPILGIRTATHAFNFEDKNHPYAHYSYDYDGPKSEWKYGFGKRVLGETWYNHHGHHKHQSTRGIIPEESSKHPILNGVENEAIWGPSDIYGVREPIGDDVTKLVLGQTIDREADYNDSDRNYGMRESDYRLATSSKHREAADPSFNPNEVLQPIVWFKSYQIENGIKGRSMTSTIGAATDFVDADVRRLFVNGVHFLLDFEVPDHANVDLVGDYNPTAFAFHDDQYWIDQKIEIK